MNHHFTRREFLAASSAAGMALGLGTAWGRAQADSGFKTKLRKALIMDRPTETGLRKLKEAGFDGVEGGVLSPAEAEACRAIAERLGMKIHSVLRGWVDFNSSDPARVQKGLAMSEDGLRAAQGFGADAMLLVPCRISGMKMPKPREFRIEFDDQTGHILKLVEGDNAPYAEYIKAHDHATDTSKEAVKRLIPLAEKTGVVIALENVWNNLWVTPPIFKHFVASFKSPWVKAYYDIGNHVKYAPPQEWIATLGSLIAKCHVKDFKLNENPGGDGTFVDIRRGSVDWPAVRAALEKVGYSGWMTIEGGGGTIEEQSQRLDLIVAGK
jgi:L-ribulose-5-phosphate 3-epimerase